MSEFKIGDRVRFRNTSGFTGHRYEGEIGVVRSYCSGDDDVILVQFSTEKENFLTRLYCEAIEIAPTYIKIPNEPIAEDKVKQGQKVWVKSTIIRRISRAGDIVTVDGDLISTDGYRVHRASYIYEREEE